MAEQGVRRHGGALRSVREGRIVRIRDDELLVAAAHPLARAATVEVRPF